MGHVIAFSAGRADRRADERWPLRTALALWIALALGGWSAIGALLLSVS